MSKPVNGTLFIYKYNRWIYNMSSFSILFVMKSVTNQREKTLHLHYCANRFYNILIWMQIFISNISGYPEKESATQSS